MSNLSAQQACSSSARTGLPQWWKFVPRTWEPVLIIFIFIRRGLASSVLGFTCPGTRASLSQIFLPSLALPFPSPFSFFLHKDSERRAEAPPRGSSEPQELGGVCTSSVQHSCNRALSAPDTPSALYKPCVEATVILPSYG